MNDFCYFLVEVMVPHLREVIARMLPLLGIAKHDNMQWVFSISKYYSQFCLLLYCNICMLIMQSHVPCICGVIEMHRVMGYLIHELVFCH